MQSELLQRFKVNELCFECEVITLPRSHHCNVCKQCVERYDHHCPWLNSCIGSKNHGNFFVFVGCQTIYILAVIVQIVAFLSDFGHSSTNSRYYDANGFLRNTCSDPTLTHFSDWCTAALTEPDDFFASPAHPASNGLVLFFMLLVLMCAVPFVFGIIMLFIVQLLNFCSGMTTLERIGS